MRALAGQDPYRIQTERRVLARQSIERAEHAARVQRQFAVRVQVAGRDRHAVQQHPVLAGRQLEVVAYMHGGNQEAQVVRELAAHAFQPCQQVAVLVLVDQRDQPIADLQAERFDRAQLVPAQFGGGRRRGAAALVSVACPATALRWCRRHAA